MISEGIETLAEHISGSESPKELRLENPALQVFSANGKLHEFVVPRGDRKHRAFTIDAVCATIEKFASDDGSGAVAWVTDRSVECVFDDDKDGRQRCVLDLDLHPMAAALLDGKLSNLRHKPFVDLLRDVRDGVDFDPEDFEKRTRTIKFTVGTETDSKRTPTSDAMGKSVRAEATGVEELPEEVVATMAVLPNDFADDLQSLRCLVRVDAESETVTLKLPQTERVRLQRAIRARVAAYIDSQSTATAFEGKAQA